MMDRCSVWRGFPTILVQITRFGLVGVLATVVHATIFSVLVGTGSMPSALANLMGFLGAFIFSFLGHSRFTFQTSGVGRAGTLHYFWRFMLVSLAGLGLNALIVYLVIEMVGLHYMVATAGIMLITPGLTFILAKFYAFRPISDAVPARNSSEERDRRTQL